GLIYDDHSLLIQAGSFWRRQTGQRLSRLLPIAKVTSGESKGGRRLDVAAYDQNCVVRPVPKTMMLQKCVAIDRRDGLRRAVEWLTVRRVAKNYARGDVARDRGRVAQFDGQVIQRLLAQPFDFVLLESRTPHHIGENVDRRANLRGHHIDTHARGIPTRRGIE